MKKAIFELASLTDLNALQNSSLNYFHDALSQKLRGTSYERVLKKRLKEGLVNQILASDFSNYNTYQRAHIQTIKNFGTSKILIWSEKKTAGIQLAHEVLNMALKYQMTEIVLSTAIELQAFYSEINFDYPKHKKYSEIVKEWTSHLNVEIQAQNHYTSIVAQIKSRRNPSHLRTEADTMISDLSQYLSESNTYRFRFLYHLLAVLRHQIANDHNKTIQACGDALDYFESISVPLPYTIRFVFLSRQITPMIHAGKFEECKNILFLTLQMPAKGSYNWNAVLQYLVFLGFHADRPDWSYSACQKVKNTKAKFESAQVDEQWRIYKAYLVLFKKHGLLDIPEQIRLYKFLNEVPEQSKDKQGFNVAILIAQMLLLLADRRWDEYAQKAESLRGYIHYHLRKNETYRIQVFMRLLLKVEQGKFRKATVGRLTENLLKKLENFPLAKSKGALESEIVPFGKLWELVMGSLK